MLEVEIKAPCRDLEERLIEMGAKRVGTEKHEDIYFNPTHRDFRESDEALRVRSVDGKYFLTYKGPRIDSEMKIREEIEIPTEPEIIEILRSLGFKDTAVVRKRRKIFRLKNLIVNLDRVENLGNFIEIESRDYRDRDKLFELLEELGIDREKSTTKSYVELLEEKR